MMRHSNKPSIREQPIPSLSEWLHFFDEQFERFMQEMNGLANRHMNSSERKQFLQNIIDVYYKRLLYEHPHERVLHSLYVIHAGITTLKKLDRYVDTLGTPEDAAYLYGHVKQVVRESETELKQLKKEGVSERYESLLHASIERIHFLVTCRKDYESQGLQLYRQIWTELLQREEWIVHEEARLSNEVVGMSSALRSMTRDRNVSVPAALMHLAFLRGDDDQALQWARTLSTSDVNLLFYPIEIAYEHNELERMLTWLHVASDQFVPFMRAKGQFQVKRDYCDFLLHYFSLYAELKHAPHVYEHALQQLLPYSYYEYNDHLFHNENYRAWAELQLLVGFQPEIHASAHLQTIERTDRTVLLPLYHQAVEKAIAEKNRSAYRLAVNRLKKLRSHYFALEKEAVWENYVTLLREKYRRLRAFQDELRKGKVVHD